jgi:serine/threonine-protein kinase
MNERDIFVLAMQKEDGAERQAFLREVRRDDPALGERVEGLLRAYANAESFLESPAPAPTLTHTPSPPCEGPGTVIGPYKLMEQIGEGGMGVVYVAEQTQPVRRRVALKIIKPGMDTKQVIARFEAERQALAMMDHPNIAKVHDGGVTDSGRPYFVMELVRGIPITDYCDRERLSISERLELFVLVCRAVQHAHQKEIIHRDLKPSNILVTVIDGAAVPKVIDFGVAKATGASLTERTIYTAFHQFVGTPLYMSPEQADLAGLDVDTRSDIYSLGVLLYELLTGTTPFDQETFRQAAFDELRRIIREQEPPKPSTRLSSLGATRATVSANRKADARQLDRAVRGELDWIVMKALEKDRTRRYETASGLAADVRRYLDDEPVQACPPSAWYRFGKFARRNRMALVTSTLVATALVLGTAVSTREAIRATRAEAQAERRAAETQLVVDYLINDVFGAAAPEKARGRTVTVHDLLAAGEKLIPARFGDSPLVEAASREALGRAYDDLGRYDEAARQFRRVAELRARLLGPDHPDTAAAESLLVRALCPRALTGGGPLDEAESVARRVLELRRRTFGPGHPEALASMTALAWVLRVKHHRDIEGEVVKHLSRGHENELIRARWTAATRAAQDLLEFRSHLNELIRARGPAAMREAQALLERSYAGQVRLLGPAHPETLATLDALGMVLCSKGDFATAEATLRQVAEARSRVLGSAHPDTLRSRKQLGAALRMQGRMDEASRLFLEVAEGFRETFGPTHSQTGSALRYTLDALQETNQGAAMRDLCQRWLREILASPVDPDPYQRSRRGSTLGELALRLTTLPAPVPFDAELAVLAAEEAAKQGTDLQGNHWTRLSLVHLRLGHAEQAEWALRESMKRRNGDDYFDSMVQALIHARRGEWDEARSWFDRAARKHGRNHGWPGNDYDQVRDEVAGLLGMTDLPADDFARP